MNARRRFMKIALESLKAMAVRSQPRRPDPVRVPREMLMRWRSTQDSAVALAEMDALLFPRGNSGQPAEPKP